MERNDEFKFKLVWQEKENEWNTALGEDYQIKDGILIFKGSRGDIVLSSNIKWIIK